MQKSVVAVVKTRPKTVLSDYQKACELAGLSKALNKSRTTILKDNITWHLFYPGVNTTPWQLEGAILALKKSGFNDIVDVHNRTVVTNPYKGEKNNKYSEIYKKYNIPRKFNFKKEDMRWINYEPRNFKFLTLHKVFPEGVKIPDYFILNFRLSYNYNINDKIMIQPFIRINNVFDKLYYTQWGLPEPGRQFWAGISCEML